jgi:general secretion pathway protein L
MMFLRRIADGFSRWIDGVAAVIIALHGWFGSSRLVRLVEQPDGMISAQAARRAKEPQGEPMQIRDGRIVEPIPAQMAATLKGSQVELILQPNRFVFRALELPRRAADFLDGVVRAQIDRLTPWSAADAAFGWSLPTEIADGRVLVIVAATAHSRIAPLVQALMGQGADGVVVSAIPQGAETASTPIRVYERKTRGSLEFQRLRRVLMSILALTGLLARTVATMWRAASPNAARRSRSGVVPSTNRGSPWWRSASARCRPASSCSRQCRRSCPTIPI